MRCPECKSQAVVKHGRRHRRQYFCTACQTLFSGTRWRLTGWLLRGMGGLGLLAALPVMVSGLARGGLHLLASDSEVPVDAIVVLGRGPNRRGGRALAAAELLRQEQADTIFVSGMTDAPPLLEVLEEMGTPRRVLAGERCSQSTWENGLFTGTVLLPQAVQRIVLVTDAPHMLRSHLVFSSFGFDVVPHPVDLDSSLGPWEHYQIMTRETIALVSYGLTGKLRPRSPDRQRQNVQAAQAQLDEWGCALNPTSSMPPHTNPPADSGLSDRFSRLTSEL